MSRRRIDYLPACPRQRLAETGLIQWVIDNILQVLGSLCNKMGDQEMQMDGALKYDVVLGKIEQPDSELPCGFEDQLHESWQERQ